MYKSLVIVNIPSEKCIKPIENRIKPVEKCIKHKKILNFAENFRVKAEKYYLYMNPEKGY
jgi:hypothetical protein